MWLVSAAFVSANREQYQYTVAGRKLREFESFLISVFSLLFSWRATGGPTEGGKRLLQTMIPIERFDERRGQSTRLSLLSWNQSSSSEAWSLSF